MKKNIVILVIVSASLFACKDKTTQTAKRNDLSSYVTNQATDSTFKDQLTIFYSTYLEIADHLVDRKMSGVGGKIKSAIHMLDKVEDNKITKERHRKWSVFKTNIKKALSNMLSENDLKVREKNFKLLSENLAAALNSFGVNKKVYEVYCPMAKATWLSDKPEVKNPYFGGKMPSCGEVKREIK